MGIQDGVVETVFQERIDELQRVIHELQIELLELKHEERRRASDIAIEWGRKSEDALVTKSFAGIMIAREITKEQE